MIDQEKITEIFKASPSPKLILEADRPYYRIREVNRAFLRFSNFTEEELIGKSILNILGESDDTRKAGGKRNLRKSLDHAIRTKTSHRLEIQRFDLPMNGSDRFEERYWSSENTPVFNRTDEVEYILHTVFDVTPQVLKERENNIIFNNTEESFVLVDRELLIVGFNERFEVIYEKIFGQKVIRGNSLLDHADPEITTSVEEICSKVLKEEKVERILKIPIDNNNFRTFITRYKPALDSDGAIYGVFITITEITGELQAREELKVSEARFRSLVEHASDVVMILSPDGTPIYASPSIQNVLGYTEEEALELDLENSIHPDDREIVMRDITKSMQQPGIALPVTPARMKHRDGTWRWCEGTLTNMLHDPSINGIVDNFRDITEQKNNEEQIRASLKEKETLLAEIHHRVKNNLAVVSGMMQLQAFKTENKELQRKLYDSMFRIKTMATVHELLYRSNNFSEIELSESLVKLVELIRETLQTTIKVEVEIECEKVHVNINQAIPASLIVNEVLTNAFKHAFIDRESGKITIRLYQGEKSIQLNIHDNGVGLPKQFKLEKKETLGVQLIDLLAQQLDSKYAYTGSSSGTSLQLTFKKSDSGNAFFKGA